MIEVKNLYAGYRGTPVLSDISMTLPQGTVTALLGPNGSGKSTLLRTICGLHKPDGGQIIIDGRPIGEYSSRALAQRVAYMVQSRNVPDILAWRMVLHGRFPYLSYPRRYRKEDMEIAEQALRQTDALSFADKPMNSLSGGQRQRVYLAMALAQSTDTILMDEPTTFLDIEHQVELMELTRELADKGKSIVLILHDLCLAMRYAGRILIINDGGLAADGSPEEIYASGIIERVFHTPLGRTAEGADYYYYYKNPLA